MVTDVLLQRARIKKMYPRANDRPFMTRELRKEMMHHTRFLNKYNKDKTNKNFEAYKRQRNKCVKMLRKAKFNYYKDLDLNNLTDNRKFWKQLNQFSQIRYKYLNLNLNLNQSQLLKRVKWLLMISKLQKFSTTILLI